MNVLIVASFLFALIIPIIGLICIIVIENLQVGVEVERDEKTPPSAHQTRELPAV